MRLSRVDLNLFVVFDAVYNERNLTRAAEVLCITQPAVSNALNRLRKTFDDQLFVRTPQGMTPTPVAENVIGRVREALQLLNSSVQERDTFDPMVAERSLSCSMNDLSEALILPSVLPILQYQAPNISLRSYYVSRDQVGKELASGSLDFAVDVPLVADTNLVHKPLAQLEYVCVVRKEHPIVGQELTMEGYLDLGHVVVSSRRKGSGLVEMALNRMGIRRNIKARVQHYMVAPKIINSTDLAWSVPLNLAKHLDLEILPLPFEAPLLELHLFWHKSVDQDPASQWLRQLFLGSVPGQADEAADESKAPRESDPSGQAQQ